MAKFRGQLRVGVADPQLATIHVGAHGVRVMSDVGVERRVAYADFELRARDGELEVRSLREDVRVSCRDARFVKAIVAKGVEIDDQVRGDLDTERKKKRTTLLFGAVVALPMMLAAIVVGYTYVAPLLVDFLPRSIDVKFGKRMAKNARFGKTIDDPYVVASLERIQKRLEPHVDGEGFEFELRVVDSPIINAFAAPGGQMLMTRGFLECAESAEQVAAVMAHEMGHVTHRHGMRSHVRNTGLKAVYDLVFEGDAGAGNVAVGGATIALMLSHSRDAELEADRHALMTMYDAGLDGRKFAEILLLMERKSGGHVGSIPEWASTHPDTARRAKLVEEEAIPLSPGQGVPLNVDWERVQRSLRSLD